VSSPTGVFELGFHASDPNRPERLYLCILYRVVRPQTVASVANHAAPAISGGPPSLTLASSGEVRVRGAALLWSANTTTRAGLHEGYKAVLVDSGSLQVRDEDGNELWDSFWQPCDTMRGPCASPSLSIQGPCAFVGQQGGIAEIGGGRQRERCDEMNGRRRRWWWDCLGT
jgi:hypothetical protein